MISIQTNLIDPEDVFLISVEALIVVGLLVAVIFAYIIQRQHAKITSGWNFIFFGLIFLLLHSIFDTLDTLQLDDFVIDILQLLDGSTFVLGLLMFAFGIYKIAEYGAKRWGL
ncbi:MAG: hypothetical protein ACFFED_14160 [Candidatus Thorarchaeota archaeon]